VPRESNEWFIREHAPILAGGMSEPTHPPSTRRSFLGALTVLLGGAIAALASVPVLGSLFSPLRAAPRPATAEEPIPVGNVSEFPVGVPRRVELVRSVTDAWSRSDATTIGAAWVKRNADDTFTAFSTVCPHLGCGVNLDKQRNLFACPCHTSAFTLDGKYQGGPAPRGMDPLEVEVRGKQVLIHYKRFKQGTPEREAV
jgi:menaquinol-cytochrome c reductase iron-sulfur subunit